MSNRRAFLQQAFIAGAGAMIIPSLGFKNDNWTRLVIVHTNDLHCHFEPYPDTDPQYAGKGGMNRISAYVKQLRKTEPELLFLDAGDFSQGTPYFNFFKGEMVLKMMSIMGYDASTIGNHEFDNGLDALAQSLSAANFPLVSSNYDFSNTVMKDKIRKNLVLERKGLRIGIYGLGIELDGLVQKVNYGNTIYNDPIEVACQQEEFLRKNEKCDFIICLSHLGYSYKQDKVCDRDIAAHTTSTDLILGGHTHTFLDSPVEVNNKNGNPVVINQVGWGALMMGYMEFYFEKKIKKQFDNAVNKRIG
jgi:5'-nucleotidase